MELTVIFDKFNNSREYSLVIKEVNKIELIKRLNELLDILNE